MKCKNCNKNLIKKSQRIFCSKKCANTVNNPVRKFSEERNLKVSLSKLNKKNPKWSGNKVGYDGLHSWVNRNIGKPKICNWCGVDNNIDLANVTGIYERDFSNWKYLCRKHHMESDGRLEVFLNFSFNYSKRYCSV